MLMIYFFPKKLKLKNSELKACLNITQINCTVLRIIKFNKIIHYHVQYFNNALKFYH